MRFRLGYVLGFACGYYLGARAGRERYEQLNRLLDKARRSEAYETASGKARDLVDDGVERARDLVEEGVERTRDFVDEHRPGAESEGIPIATIAGSDIDPTEYDVSPGPPPAGSLTEDPRPGGPAGP